MKNWKKINFGNGKREMEETARERRENSRMVQTDRRSRKGLKSGLCYLRVSFTQRIAYELSLSHWELRSPALYNRCEVNRDQSYGHWSMTVVKADKEIG